MHSEIDAIKSKGLRRVEPDRNEIFTDDNHESASYRKATTEIFSKKTKLQLTVLPGLSLLLFRVVENKV